MALLAVFSPAEVLLNPEILCKVFFSLILVAKGLLFQNLQGALGRVHSVHP